MRHPSISSWRLHYERLERSYNRVISRPRGIDEAEDGLAHYLTDCWHLKDWIAADPNSGVSGKKIERLVMDSLVLRIVGDLANATKHHIRKYNREGAYVSRMYFSRPTPLTPNDPRIQRRTVRLSDGREFDLDGLVTDSWSKWQEILRTLTLL